MKHFSQKTVPLVLIILSLSFLTSCHFARYISLNVADVHDLWRFPYLTIEPGDTAFQFTESSQLLHPDIPDGYIPSLPCAFEEFLDDHKTTCFLIIRNDTILYEKYFAGYTKDSLFPSFSITKSFVSALTGIAVSEGKIQSIDQKVTEFIPWIKRIGFQQITIENLLNMRSGIRFNEGYSNPFGGVARFYYGTDLKKFVSRLKIKETPGLYYDYISANGQILGFVLEAATEEKITYYLQESIWKQIGMEHCATWNVDSEKHGNVKMFCCLNACPRDFAKFGRLYLYNGSWNGKQIIPETWVKRSTSILNDSRDGDNYPYAYFWRVLDGEDSFFSKGVLGQYIYVNRPKKLIMLRFGKGYGNIDWADFFDKMTTEL